MPGPQRHIHWLVPTTMFTSLLLGALLAIGHHLFYDRLSGTPTSTDSFAIAGRKLSRQQFNTAVGTAFASLVRTCLALAVTTAYVQIFWQSMKKAKRVPTLADLDWASAGTKDMLNLLNFRLAWRYPLLAILIVVCWWGLANDPSLPGSD